MKVTDVAVAVFLKPDGSFLLSSRPAGKPYAGYWEFPGGKIEPGESVRDALTRELIEELNVVIDEATPWFTFVMHYEHATVRLHTWRVHKWHDVDAGRPNARGMCGLEGQQFVWQTMAALNVTPTLPGCVPIFRALALPALYVVTNAAEIGAEAYLQQIRAVWSKSAWKRPPLGEFDFSGPRLIQLREKAMPAAERLGFTKQLVQLAHANAAKVLVNSDIALAEDTGADGVHLTAEQLMRCTRRPDVDWVGASVHDRAELVRAAELRCDFAVLGAVKPTASHPGRATLGWPQFASIVADTPLPVYAIGGMHATDLRDATRSGAHGVAMQRGALAHLLAK